MRDVHFILKRTDLIGSKLSFEYCSRRGGAAALFDLAHEHAKAIAILIEEDLAGSAHALLRACIEAYVRGSWILRCATEIEVSKFTQKDAQWPKLSKQMADLEDHHGLPRAFKRYLGKTMGTLDALTHGLSTQIRLRYNGSNIEFRMAEQDLAALIKEVSYISILSNLELAGIANDSTAVSELESLLPELESF